MNPQDIRLHDVDTSKGNWGIYVQSVVQSQDGASLFLTLILEQSIDDERVKTRHLKISVLTAELESAVGRIEILSQIRNWIEMTEGDSYLDATSKPNRP